jgi:hypothetical protein
MGEKPTSKSAPDAVPQSAGVKPPALDAARQAAPLIPPIALTLNLRHPNDPNRRRATFQVAYPVLEIILERTADLTEKLPPRFENGRRTLTGIRFFIKVPDLFIGNSDFKQCKFHRPAADNGDSRVAGTTFADCTFEKTVFGGTFYRHVRFERCAFRRCDFGMSQFIDCHFHSCSFLECTGEHVSFSATEINPDEIMVGMVVPLYNYGPDSDGEPNRRALESQWLEIRRALAAQLLKSNGEIHNTRYCDAALVQLKTSELRLRYNLLKYRTISGETSWWVSDASQCWFLWLVLFLTKGGTSVARLIGLAALAVPTYTALLAWSCITFQGRPCHLGAFQWSAIIQEVAYASSLFLAVGYTAFSGRTVYETVFLTIGAALGLVWYALLAAVVIRRVYR